jgi:DNA-binding CsgD family transcriptional regulator
MERLFDRERELAEIDGLLDRGGAVLVEGAAGIGKTALLDVACTRAAELGHEVLRARGSELETGFAFGVVRQLFERRLANTEDDEREVLLAGHAGAVRSLLLSELAATSASDISFAVLHGLYWLTANLAQSRPLLLAVDDVHWADEASTRWLAHLTPRLDGLAVGLLVAHRARGPESTRALIDLLQVEARAIVRPQLLTEDSVHEIIRTGLGAAATDGVCAAVWQASGGNPLYVAELVRAVELDDEISADGDTRALFAGGREGIASRVVARARSRGPRALALAHALAVLGDDCELRHAAAMAGIEISEAILLAAELVGLDVLAPGNHPRFVHPVVRDALEDSIPSDARDGLHRAAARLLHDDGAPAGQVAAHLERVQPIGDAWVLARLREAGRMAMRAGAPSAAARLLHRALSEPPALEQRADVLREAARADASAGRETAYAQLEEALRLTSGARQRAEIALEMAETYAALFRWVDAVDVLEQALAELGQADEALAAQLEAELVVCGLQDARRAARVGPALERLAARQLSGSTEEAAAVARGMGMVLAGRPADEAAAPLEETLSRVSPAAENWDTRAALLWSLVTAEHFDTVEEALGPMAAEVHRSGSARGFVAAYSTLGLLKLRLGALPEADVAARVALRVLQEADFVPGLAFAATLLADVAVEAGALDEAQALIELLPQDGWPAGVGTVLIPAARGRLRLAQGRPADALADFQTCASMFSPDLWGTEMRDVGYVHARAGAAEALLRLGEREAARELARAEVDDVRVFAAPRALGIALRVAGLVQGGSAGLELLEESVVSLRSSPALLERAHSLAELGAAMRRANRRSAARQPLAEALELAVRCGARRLAARAREELKATGARPRRDWQTGIEALTPSELRVVRLAVEGRTNREIAQELYVTLKTVEGHLSRAYTKLRIEGRGELPRVLKREKTRVATL